MLSAILFLFEMSCLRESNRIIPLKTLLSKTKNMDVFIHCIHKLHQTSEESRNSDMCSIIRIIHDLLLTFGDAVIPRSFSKMLMVAVLGSICQLNEFKAVQGSWYLTQTQCMI